MEYVIILKKKYQKRHILKMKMMMEEFMIVMKMSMVISKQGIIQE
jgi:hypothetical protein